LCWAAHLAAAFDARLIAMHAVPAIESGPGEYFDRELVADLSKAAREEMVRLTEGLETPAKILIEAGQAAKAVHEAAVESQADVLVIARGSAGSGSHGRLRTNAYAIIRESPCPVVSV
jgi:nucleotide-binding universal stress UspA family protein